MAAKRINDYECGLCSGVGPWNMENDPALTTLYKSMRGNPDRIRGFLARSNCTACSGLQIYLATGDPQIGEEFVRVYRGSRKRLLSCEQREDMVARLNLRGLNRLRGVSLGTLAALVEESLNDRLENRDASLPLGQPNPTYENYGQRVLTLGRASFTADANEDNPDSLSVVEKKTSRLENNLKHEKLVCL